MWNINYSTVPVKGIRFVALLLFLAAPRVRGNDPAQCQTISYLGTYKITGEWMQLVKTSEDSTETIQSKENNDDVPPYQIEPGPAGPFSYVVNKGNRSGTHRALDIQTSGPKDAGATSPDALCFAPPQPNAPMTCVDTADTGTTQVYPLEVDDDCALTKAWKLYTEPATVGCGSNPNCFPSMTYAELERMESASGEGGE